MGGTSKIYAVLFFMIGLTLGMMENLSYIFLSALITFYVLHHTIWGITDDTSRSLSIFFCVCAVVFLHSAIMTLIELSGSGYNPFNSLYHDFGAKNTIKVFMGLIGVYVMFQCFRDRDEGMLFLQSFAWGNIVYLVIILIVFRNFIQYGEGIERLSLANEETGDTLYTNVLAYLFLLFFYANLIAFRFASRYFYKMTHFVFCCVSAMIIVLTQSRTSLFALLLGLIVGVCLSWRRIIITAVIMALFFLFLGILGFSPQSMIPQRFTVSQAVQDKASGRTGIWRDYLDYITLADWVVGRGYITADQSVLYQKPVRDWPRYAFNSAKSAIDTVYYPHNQYLQIAIHFGLIGLFLYFCFALNVLWRLSKRIFSGHCSFIYLSMFCSCLFHGLAEARFYYPKFAFFIFWAIALSKAFSKDENYSCNLNFLYNSRLTKR